MFYPLDLQVGKQLEDLKERLTKACVKTPDAATYRH